jgi:hypothetical protein
MTQRIFVAALVALCSAGIACGGTSSSASTDEQSTMAEPPRPRGPGQATAHAAGAAVRAIAESFCLRRRGGGGGCVDSEGVTGASARLPAHPDDTVTVRLGAAPRQVRAWLARFHSGARSGDDRVSPNLPVARAGARQWRVHLPAEISADDVMLRVVVRYRDYPGDAVEFGVPLALWDRAGDAG